MVEAPRGIRNHNPGNLRQNSRFIWQGQTGSDTDGFCIFQAPFYGLRALARNLHTYITKYRLTTIDSICARWAPTSDGNNPDAYAQAVADYSHIPRLAHLHVTPATLKALTLAIVFHENGEQPYHGDLVSRAITAAL